MYDLPFFDDQARIIGYRKMKAYLVKDEGTLQILAQQKFDEEIAKDPNYMALSRGKMSSIDAYSTSFGSINSERALNQINSVP